MIKLVGRFLLLFPVLVVVSVTNVVVDPSNVYWAGEKRTKEIANLLLQGWNVEDREAFPDRRLQREVIRGFRKTPEVIVFGSSRTWAINSGLFPDSRFYNHSVPGASLEDFIGLYSLYRDRDWHPKQLVLGVDPWIFNRNHTQKRWLEIERDHDRLRLELEPGFHASLGFRVADLKKIFSPGYFKSSLRMLLQAESRVVSTKQNASESRLYLADGYRRWERRRREQSIEEVRVRALGDIRAEGFSMEDYEEIDPNLFALFDKFLSLVAGDGVRITIFLAPFHPLVYDHLTSLPRYARLVEAEDVILRLARRGGWDVFGSYDPKRVGLKDGDFYDGVHPRDEVARAVMKGAPRR